MFFFGKNSYEHWKHMHQLEKNFQSDIKKRFMYAEELALGSLMRDFIIIWLFQCIFSLEKIYWTELIILDNSACLPHKICSDLNRNMNFSIV